MDSKNCELDSARHHLHRVIRIREVERLVGRKRSSIYALMSPSSRYFDPDFPQKIRLSNQPNGSVGWMLSEILAWIELKAMQRTGN